MIFKNINSEDISGLIICSEPPISSSAIRTKETTIDGRDGAIVEKLGYKTRIRNVEIGLKKDANVDKILSYFSGEGDLIFKNENDKVYKAAIYEQVDLERLLRLRKGSVAFYCQPFKYKRNDIFETIKDNKVKEKKGKHLELLNCAEQNVVDLKLEGSTSQVTRSGKNLFNLNNIRNAPSIFTVTETGVNLTNDWAGDVFTFENIAKTFKANTTYTMKAKAKVVSRPSTIVNINDNIFLFYRPASDELGHISKSILEMPDKRTIALNTEKEYITSFTTPEDMTNVRFLSYTFRGNNDGSTTETALGEIDVSEIMLVEGSYTAETFPEYEQYGASPSPDYPSPIENVAGKNKFNNNFSDYTKPTDYYICPIHVKNETSYKFNINLIGTKMTGCVIGIVKDGNQYSNFVGLSQALNSVGSVNNLLFKVDNTWVSPKLVIYAPKGETQFKQIFENYEVQLEEGTTATPYAPYNSLEVKNIGENLFDINNRLQGTINNDGDLEFTTNTNKFYEYDFKENTQYTLSAFVRNTNTTGNVRLRIWYTDKTNSGEVLLNRTTEYKYLTFTSLANKTIDYISVTYGSSGNMYIKNGELSIVEGTTATPYKPYQEQKLTFPLSEGQKLYEGSYLADDGIHNVRGQRVFDGSDDESWQIEGTNNFYSNIVIQNSKSLSLVLCNYQKSIKKRLGESENCFISNSKKFNFQSYTINHTVADFKNWLSTHNLIVEYELATEEIVTYTTAQQEAYNQLQKLKLYKGQNIMFSLEGSIINLKYLEDTDEKVENQGNIYSKPIIRLEKTVFKEVEIAINGIRFKYNFEEDDYVEIDCEEMTVQYEGLNRNRRLVIDFEFPKLKEGNNDIIMYDGDCIIKCKRKDRWL